MATNYNFRVTDNFKKSFKSLLKKYPSLKGDINEFIGNYADNERLGDDLGGGFKKIRMAIK